MVKGGRGREEERRKEIQQEEQEVRGRGRDGRDESWRGLGERETRIGMEGRKKV